MVYLLSSLLNSIQMLLYMFFMNAFFVRRHNSRLFWGYWLLWALIATVATNVFPSSIQLNGPFVFLMEIVILYGMNVTLYYGRWDRRLFTVVTSYAAIYSISSLMETLLLRITHMTRAEYLNNAPLYILFCFIRLGVLGIIVALINRFHAPLKELGKPRVWVPFATFFPPMHAVCFAHSSDLIFRKQFLDILSVCYVRGGCRCSISIRQYRKHRTNSRSSCRRKAACRCTGCRHAGP